MTTMNTNTNTNTMQNLFNKMYLGLKGQNWVTSAQKGVCKYRGPNDTKCAIGHLISDETAEILDVEGYTVMSPRFFDSLNTQESEALGPFADFLRDAQVAHDGGTGDDGDDIKVCFERLAAKYNLTIPE